MRKGGRKIREVYGNPCVDFRDHQAVESLESSR